MARGKARDTVVGWCHLVNCFNLWTFPFYKLIIKFPLKYRLIQLNMSQACPKLPPFFSGNYNSVYSKTGIPWHSYEQTCREHYFLQGFDHGRWILWLWGISRSQVDKSNQSLLNWTRFFWDLCWKRDVVVLNSNCCFVEADRKGNERWSKSLKYCKCPPDDCHRCHCGCTFAVAVHDPLFGQEDWVITTHDISKGLAELWKWSQDMIFLKSGTENLFNLRFLSFFFPSGCRNPQVWSTELLWRCPVAVSKASWHCW